MKTATKDFKMTELGPIPKDWEVKRLGDVATLNGRIGFRGYTVKDIVGCREGAISLSPSNMIDGALSLNECTYISWTKYEESPEIKVRKGDVLIVKTGSTVGKSAYVNEAPWRMTVNPQIAVFKGFTVDGRLFAYYIGSPLIQEQISKTVVGSTIPTLSQEKVKSFIFPCPPLPEQRKIAAVLSDVDEMIAALVKLIEKKRKIKTGAMQRLLTGKTRLPGFKGAWVEKRLGDCFEIMMGQSPESRFYNNARKGLPLIQGNADIQNRWSIIRMYTSQVTKVCEKGDVILSVRAPVGAVGRASCRSCLGRGVCAIKSTSDFLYHYLVYVENRWGQYSTGSTFDSINSDQLANVLIALPPTLAEQKAIAKVLGDMDEEIAALESELAKTRQLKQGMMQELLTGKVRLV